MIRLREFEERDAAVLQKKQMPDVGTEEITDMIRAWRTKTFDGKRFEMLAVLSDDTVVGSVSLYERSKSVASVGIEVFADERGKGYASAAMKRIAETARNRGYRVIWDQVAANNKPSISLHEKLGFETDGYIYRNAKDCEVLLWLFCL
mgnify:CR=1 FL=1